MPKPVPNVSYVVVNVQGKMQYRFGEREKAKAAAARMNASHDPYMIPLKPYSVIEEMRCNW